MKEIELINKRKRREKHFLQENGDIVAKIYDEDIHFLKDGKYEDIDNTLVKENNFYHNKNNDYKASFAINSNDYLTKIEKDNYYLNIRLKNSNDVYLKNHSKILYENIFDKVDIEYELKINKVKESIILKDKESLVNDFEFIIDTNLELSLNNKEIIASKDNINYFKIEKPFMLDSSKVINNNIDYKLIREDNHYLLKLISTLF